VIASRKKNEVVDITNATKAAGSRVGKYGPHGGVNQAWHFDAVV